MNELRRQIGVRTATALVVGEVIAVGIFLTPAGMAKDLGSPMLLLAVWLVMGVMALCGALCYGELAARYPQAGGGYVYLREAYGPAVAFMYGWMAFLVMDPGLTALLGVGLATYAGYSLNLSPAGIKVFAIATIMLVALINIRGVKLGAGFIRTLTFLKLGLLAFIVLWGVGFQLGDWSNFSPFVARRANLPLVDALAGGLVGAFFAFAGWWDLGKLAGEVKNPGRTLPLALAYGVVVIMIVYILTSFAFLYLVPLDQVTSGETFAAQAGEVLFGRAGGLIFSLVVVVAVLGSLAAVIMSAPRVYFAMARDGVFFPSVAVLHKRFETPARAIALQAVLASVLVVAGSFNQILSYFVFVVVVFIAFTVAALFKFRREDSYSVRYLTPGYPVTPVVFLIMIVFMLVLLGSNNPKQASLGVAVVALGLPVYLLVFRNKWKEGALNDLD